MRIWVCVGLVLSLAACAQPFNKLNSMDSQYKVASARHWQSLAARTANRLATRISKIKDIETGGYIAPGGKAKPLTARPFYINTAQSDSPFAKVFTPLLQEALLKKGYRVSRTPQNATVINYDAKTYYYGGHHEKRLIDYATFWTTAGALGILASDTSMSAGVAALAVAAVGPPLDVMIEKGAITNAEVVLTTSVVSPNSVLYESSEPFYIYPRDLPFYWSALPASAPMDTAKMQPRVEPVQTIQVAGTEPVAGTGEVAGTGIQSAYRIFFDWNKTNIRPDARKVLEEAAAAYKRGNFVKITLTGYTDRSGAAPYNMGLSVRRADAAKEVLVQLGITAKDIATVGKGEADPLVPTADGVRQSRNRRVDIVL